MNLDRNRSWLLWAAGFALLLLFYDHIFVLEPVNSDSANVLLAAEDMAAGNWRLGGWFMPPDSFLGLDDVSYALIWRLTGNALMSLRLVPALQWTGLMILATYFAARPQFYLQKLAILGAALFVPVFGPITEHFYFRAPSHVATTIFMLSAVALCERMLQAGRIQWRSGSLFCVIVIDASFSDPFFQSILTMPLLLSLWAGKMPGYREIGLLYLFCVGFGMLSSRLNAATGGFTQPPSTVGELISFQDIPNEIARAMLGCLGICGCFPFGQPFLPAILAIIRMPLLVLLFASLFRVARKFQVIDFADRCLLLIVSANIGAAILTGKMSDVSGERFLLPAWVCIAVFTAKYTYEDRAVRCYCLLLTSLALGCCMVKLMQAPMAADRFFSGEERYVAALEARGLSRGYAGYWQASDTTVATGGKIKIAALTVGSDGELGDCNWVAKADWYKGDATSARFFVSVAANSRSSQAAAIIAAFGPADDMFVINNGDGQGTITTYVYDRPLPAIRCP